jgi:hypothetical protein
MPSILSSNWPRGSKHKVHKRLLRKLISFVAVLALLVVLAAPMVLGQQDASENFSGEEEAQALPPDPTLTNSVGTDPTNENAGLLQYRPSPTNGGIPISGQAVPLCPEPVAPDASRCHSLIVVPSGTSSPQYSQ